MTETNDPETDDEKDIADDQVTEVQELIIERHELVMRNGTGAGRASARPCIRLHGVPGSASGVLRLGKVYFRRSEQAIEGPRLVTDVRTPHVSMFVWLDNLPMVQAQLSQPKRRLVFQRFASGNVRAEIIAGTG